MKKVRKNTAALKVLSKLGEKETVSKKEIKDIEKSICEVYGKKQLGSVNDVFLKHY